MIIQLDTNGGTLTRVLDFLVEGKTITNRTAIAALRSGYLRIYVTDEDYREAKAGEKVRIRATSRRKRGQQ